MRLLYIIIYLFSFLANCHEYEKKNITVDHPILKVSSKKSKLGAGYMNIINNSKNDVHIEKILATTAKKIEIHQVFKEDEVYKMRPIKKAILIPAGSNLIFKAKSYHVMFYDFLEPLEKDDFVKAEIYFSNNLVIPVEFKVVLATSKHSHH